MRAALSRTWGTRSWRRRRLPAGRGGRLEATCGSWTRRASTQIADEDSEPVPTIILTREPAPLPANRRVVASLTRPALFRDLYVALQLALEATPRSYPRVTTALPARCTYEDRACTGIVVSLSEGGCLFRGADEPLQERQTSLQFPLPGPGLISARARHVDRRGTHLGLVFEGLPSSSRTAISRYVMDRIIGG